MQTLSIVSIAMFSAQLHVGARDALAAQIVQRIVGAAQAAIDARDVFTLAIPGGSVADACLPRLIVADVLWEKCHVFWCDERAVPLTDANSNAGSAFRLWQGTPFARAAHLHVMYGDALTLAAHVNTNVSNIDGNARLLDDMRAAATKYTSELTAVAGTPIILDVALLGVGEDGHVASLFPGHASAMDVSSTVIMLADSPKPPPGRLSLSFGVLAQTREVIIAAFGQEKANAMQQALENPASQLPVARIVQRAPNVHVMLDPEAAGALRHTHS